jgi:ATP-dependent RNA helicase DHX37/DHR1
MFEKTFLKTVKIHSKLTKGGILVFATGQQEVKHLVKKLRGLFPFSGSKEKPSESKTSKENEENILDYSDDEELDNIKKAIKNSEKKSGLRLICPR